MFLLVNKYNNPNNHRTSIQCHELDSQLNTVKSYPRMDGDSLELFNHYEYKLVVSVLKISLLNEINVIK